MTLHSFSYLLFLCCVYLIFYRSAERWRRFVLLGSSYLFYLALGGPTLLAALLTVTAIGYLCGVRIAALTGRGAERSLWYWGGTFGSLLPLGLMKYSSLFSCGAPSFFGLAATTSSSIEAVGVSFFSLQAVSYLTDVYWERTDAENDSALFALYLGFFPKLLQGPIERSSDLLPQLKTPYRFDYHAMRSGALLFSWGLLKKVALADRLAPYADRVFNNPHQYHGLTLVLATYAFALQLFLDFSAYTDMARGSARIFGINLSRNFDNPYLATSIADFWRRWHISFSSWLLDYVFRPLQMQWRNLGRLGTGFALLVTFALSGFWHGASWCFISWGVIHGGLLFASLYFDRYRKKRTKIGGSDDGGIARWVRVAVTFHLVCFSWIFFRANTIGDALYIVRSVCGIFSGSPWQSIDGLKHEELAAFFIAAAAVLAQHRLGRSVDIGRWPGPYRWGAYMILALLIVKFGFVSHTMFVYQRF